jgi:predicted ATPase
VSIVSNKPVSSPVLIGRQLELTILHTLIAQARQGQGQVILLSGEAGIGKSRLAAEVKTQAHGQGFLVLQGSCFPTDRSAPYHKTWEHRPLLKELPLPRSVQGAVQQRIDQLSEAARHIVSLAAVAGGSAWPAGKSASSTTCSPPCRSRP